MITVVGLGRTKDEITLSGKRAIKNADILIVKTFSSVLTRRFKNKNNAFSLDEIYNGAENFSALNNKIADFILDKERDGKNIAYLVAGDGYSDASVIELYKRTEINIAGGVSLGQKMPSLSSALFCATEVIEVCPQIDTQIPLSVIEIDNMFLASELKLYLLKFYGADEKIIFTHNNKDIKICMQELDRQKKYDCSSCVYIAANTGFNKQRYGFSDLIRIMERLTKTDGGCEWDKAQTHKSIHINMIEEAYEAADAILAGDIAGMIEETGDVLLQTVFHADIAKRTGEYDLFDVIHALCNKLVTRHTHIFGEDTAADSASALGFWEKAKAKEKSITSLKEDIDAIPKLFPATLRLEKVIKKSLKKGGESLKNEEYIAKINDCIINKDYQKALYYISALCVVNKINLETALLSECESYIKVTTD